MNKTETEPTTSTITSNNNEPKQNGNDQQRTARKNQGKQAHNNDLKKSRKMKANQQDSSTKVFQMMQEQIRNRLMCCEPGRELEVIHTTLIPEHQTLWRKCMEVKKDLLLAFQCYYPFVRLEVFGSTVMGIAFKDSDFDFFVELSREPINAKPASIIGKAMNILRQSGNFTNFLPISHARVPILKCYHIRTGYQCDINFSDSYGILNSPIVARILMFDSRIYVLAKILKYWTKVHDCAGKNRISNYAIVHMLLFYLQQLPAPILPPISEFQRRVPPYFVNGYNFAFDDRLTNQTVNQSRCSDLLMGFFKFYKNFDFDSQVICPLFGRAFRKVDIADKKLPEFKRYHEMLHLNPNLSPMQFNKCICIQDPFEITHSIPGLIATSEFQKILCRFEYAAEIMETELKTMGESTNLLLSIFDADNFQRYTEQKLQKPSAKQRLPYQSAVFRAQNSTACKTVLHIKPTDYHLSMVREILTKKINETNAKIDSSTIHRSWAEHVVQCVVLMLQDIFMLKIDDATDQKSNETQTISTNTTTNTTTTTDKPMPKSDESDTTPEKSNDDSDRFSREFDVSGSRDVFLGRKQTKKITVDSLNAEILESQERFKNMAIEMHLKANIKIRTDIKNFDSVAIELNDLIKTKKNNSFKTFLTNFDQNLNNMLKIYLMHKHAATSVDNEC